MQSQLIDEMRRENKNMRYRLEKKDALIEELKKRSLALENKSYALQDRLAKYVELFGDILELEDEKTK